MKRSRLLLAVAPFILPFVALGGRAQSVVRARATAAVQLATLAERIAKLDAQVGMGVLAQRSRRALGEAMKDFELIHRALLAAAPFPDVREALQLAGLLWQDYRAWASKPPSRDNARKLGERTEELVWVAMKAARLLNASPRGAAEALAFKAAEAGALSQRIPRLALWRRWGIRDEGLLNELRLSEAQLQAALASLRAEPGNSPEVAAELQIVESQAAFLAEASRQLEGGKDAARHLEFIAKSGDHILESLRRVVVLYEG